MRVHAIWPRRASTRPRDCRHFENRTGPLEPQCAGVVRGGDTTSGRTARGGGPAGLPDGPAYRPIPQRQVRRARVLERAAHPLGFGESARSKPPLSTRCTKTWPPISRTRSCTSLTRGRAPILCTACRFGSSMSSPGTTCSHGTCSYPRTIRRNAPSTSRSSPSSPRPISRPIPRVTDRGRTFSFS